MKMDAEIIYKADKAQLVHRRHQREKILKKEQTKTSNGKREEKMSNREEKNFKKEQNQTSNGKREEKNVY